jgi:predicted Ser/Thr protein kinase
MTTSKIQAADSKSFLPRDPFPASFPGLKATLRDLLKVLRANPAYVESTHSAFVRLISRGGIDEVATSEARRLTGNENIFAYKTVTKKFFGVEERCTTSASATLVRDKKVVVRIARP